MMRGYNHSANTLFIGMPEHFHAHVHIPDTVIDSGQNMTVYIRIIITILVYLIHECYPYFRNCSLSLSLISSDNKISYDIVTFFSISFFVIDTFFSICKRKFKQHTFYNKGRRQMISYAPLWDTMKERGITTYTLITKHNINPRTINNLKHNRSITMDTLEKLCLILDCSPNDVVSFL